MSPPIAHTTSEPSVELPTNPERRTRPQPTIRNTAPRISSRPAQRLMRLDPIPRAAQPGEAILVRGEDELRTAHLACRKAPHGTSAGWRPPKWRLFPSGDARE